MELRDYLRILRKRGWIILLLIGTQIITRVDQFGLGYALYRITSDVEFLRGRMTRYEHRSDETGRWLTIEFCPVCGTPVTHTTELRPGLRGISAGTMGRICCTSGFCTTVEMNCA